MQKHQQQSFIRTDGSIDTPRAITRGHDARTEALRAGLARLAAWLRRPRAAGHARSAEL